MMESRRTSIPILHTRGTFYEVGYDVVSPILVWSEKKSGCYCTFRFAQVPSILSSILPYISYIATLLRYLNFHWSRTLENIFE